MGTMKMTSENESGYKGRVRFCSVFLAMLMVLYAIPSAALASLRNDESVPGVDPSLADSVFELPELRTATDKTFRLENGYFYVAHYNTGIHIKDADGNWQDIDNRLNVSGDEIATGDHRIKFAKKTTGNEAIFTMHSGNGKLTLSLDGAAKKIAGQTVNNSEDESGVGTSLQKMTTLGNISASVKYCDILPATDLEYVLHGTTVKENIIVKERQDKYCYSFTMRLNNMYAEPDDSGGIAVYDSNTHEIEYYIPAPVMWDANNVASHDVGMDLEDGGSGKYTITITADSNWINAAERAFPVVIDPPVYAGGGSNVLDLTISSSSPSSASTGDTSIRVGNSNKAYWKLTQLPELPDHAYITDASFTMECYTASSAVNGYVAVYDVLTDWDSTLTWNKTISQTAPEGQQSEHFLDFEQIYTLYVPGVGYELNDTNGYNWNVTPIVKKWYSGENYGLMFAPATGTSFTGTALFRSNDYSVSSLRPQLSITYIDMKGLEDYWTYTSQDAGFAGVASVNNATGNLVVTIPTLTTPDALMPITPAMVYNFCLDFADYEYPNAQTANTSSFTPRGFKMNLNETLLKKEYVDADGETGYYFVWADGDGTEHYFMPTGESNKYADEDGLMLELEESDQVCTVTDDADTVRTFSSRTKPNGVVSAWYLSKITDRSGNSVIISVDSGYRPTAVKLKPNGKPETEQLRIAYNDAGVPYVVWNPASGEGVVFRYSNSYSGSISASYGGYLRRTIRAHGGTTESQWEAFYDTNVDTGTSVITVDAVAEYTYNHLGLMSRITNTLSQYEIRYNTYATKQVSAVREYSTVNDEIGQKVNFTYGTSSTVIRTSGSDDIFNNSDDLLTTCCFDSSGRTVSCYTTDLDRTMIYGASNSQYVGDENEKAKNSIKMSVLTSQQSPNYLLNGGFVHNGVASLLRWNTTGNVSAVTLEPYPTDNATYAAKLSIGGSVTTSTLSNTVLLKEGEYSLSAIVKSSGISSGVSAYLKAESLSDPANSFTATRSASLPMRRRS